MLTCTLSPGFGGLSAGNAVRGRTPSVLNPISSTIESEVSAITGPSRLWPPGSRLREWLCSYWEHISLYDSVGTDAVCSLSTGDSWLPAVDEFGSDMLGLDVSGLDMKEVKALR